MKMHQPKFSPDEIRTKIASWKKIACEGLGIELHNELIEKVVIATIDSKIEEWLKGTIYRMTIPDLTEIVMQLNKLEKEAQGKKKRIKKIVNKPESKDGQTVQ